MADDSALIVVAPSDGVDAIIQKIRGAGADSVELLVPDGTPALQALGGFARLRQSLERDRIGLLVISSDEKTLNAARLNQLDTMGVQGTRVVAPPSNGEQANRYATRILHGEPGAPPNTPIAAHDAEFLDALDQMPTGDRYAADEDADLYAALDDLPDAGAYRAAVDRGERSEDDDFAAALDEWSSGAGERGSSGEDWDAAFGAGDSPRQRVRAEDLALSDDEMGRQRGSRRTGARRARAETGAPSAVRGTTKSRRGSTAAARLLDLEEAEEALPRRMGIAPAIPLLILLLIVGIAAIWYFRSRATITVTPPSASTTDHPFKGEVIPLTTGSANKSADAVLAFPISADATFSAQGQVISETLSPAGTAKGGITIYNALGQTINLPQGTEFIGTNGKGADVHFTLDADATVPAATTSSSPAGTTTTNGKIDVAITARAPGGNSNVGENAIKQIVIPGQPPIANGSTLIVQNGPITGGSDQPVRIVTDNDVQRVLQEALTGLYNAGVQALQGQIDPKTQGIDPVSIYPGQEALGDPKNYELVVNPPVGQPVDASNPNFTVTVKTRFSGLVTPRDQPVDQQLQTVVAQHFKSPCKAGEQPGLEVSNRYWDGTRLTIDGTISCTPSKGLTPEAANLVKNAVRGKSRAEAEKSLKALTKDGLIGSYTLPPGKEQFPSLDFLLTVEQGQPAQSQPSPAPQ